MSREDERHLSTADIAGSAARQPEQPPPQRTGGTDEPLAPLFLGPVADEFRERWNTIQIGFVDDPRRAVQGADELVAQVMQSLAQNFSEQRSRIEEEVARGDVSDTENLRVALQRYRSFFQRLLSI